MSHPVSLKFSLTACVNLLPSSRLSLAGARKPAMGKDGGRVCLALLLPLSSSTALSVLAPVLCGVLGWEDRCQTPQATVQRSVEPRMSGTQRRLPREGSLHDEASVCGWPAL